MKCAVCVVVRNESSLIVEWIAHYLTLGFDSLIIVDHSSEDDTLDVLNKIAKIADVRVIKMTQEGSERQFRAYESVCASFKYEFDWIGFFDADEFLMPEKYMRIGELLSKGSEASGIAIQWKMFGSSGHKTKPQGLVLDNFTKRAPMDFAPNNHVKVIVRPMEVSLCRNPHCFDLRGPYVNSEGHSLTWNVPGITKNDVHGHQWYLNHYFTRSYEHWQSRMQRGQLGTVIRTEEEFHVNDRNEETELVNPTLLNKVKHRVNLFKKHLGVTPS